MQEAGERGKRAGRGWQITLPASRSTTCASTTRAARLPKTTSAAQQAQGIRRTARAASRTACEPSASSVCSRACPRRNNATGMTTPANATAPKCGAEEYGHQRARRTERGADERHQRHVAQSHRLALRDHFAEPADDRDHARAGTCTDERIVRRRRTLEFRPRKNAIDGRRRARRSSPNSVKPSGMR